MIRHIVTTVAVVLLTARAAMAILPPDARNRIVNSGIVAMDVVDRLDAEGSANVTVAIDMPAELRPTGEPGLDLAAWNAAVATARSELLSALTPGEFATTYEYQSVAAIAGRATLDAVIKLVDSGKVIRIDADAKAQATLTEAVPFVHLTSTQAMGMTGAGVTVAVLDTGIDAQHPDLAAAVEGEECFCILDGQGCCPDGSSRQSGVGSAQDDRYHGTYVSGIVAGRGLTAPRGGTPGAGVFAIKVLNRIGWGDSSGIVAALDWLLNVRPDIQIANMSLGHLIPLFDADCDDYDTTTMMYRDVINALRSRGTTTIAAAGNEGSTIYMDAPACVHGAVSVTASYDNDPANAQYDCFFPAPQTDGIWCFSNVNHFTDITAPGVNITSANLGGGSVTKSGTSAAAPLVSACAAALRQANPALTPFDIELALKSATKIHDARSDQQYPPSGIDLPRLDCVAAMEQVLAGRGLCPSSPRFGCEHPGRTAASKFQLKVYETPDRRDSLRWQWKYGSVAMSELGVPADRTSYSVCAYDSSGQQFMSLFAPGGTTCLTKPCWSQSMFGTGRIKYVDRLLTPSGISYMIVRAGADQRASLLVKGKGPNLALPRSHINTPLRVQLINNESNDCWEATFPTASTNSTGTGVLIGKLSAVGQ